jgi:hypothetical protein
MAYATMCKALVWLSDIVSHMNYHGNGRAWFASGSLLG